MNLVATSFAMQPICNDARAAHALPSDQHLFYVYNICVIILFYNMNVLTGNIQKCQNLSKFVKSCQKLSVNLTPPQATYSPC